jgi:NhaA family Na+:H+ antiporter
LIILPLFALANTCILFTSSWQSEVANIVSIGIIIGLVIGKPLGIVLFSRLGALLGICKLTDGLTWRQILGAGILAGIGFTMSIFITLLAFDDKEMINNAKMAIVIASTIAGVIGLIYLKSQLIYPANSNLDKPQ